LRCQPDSPAAHFNLGNAHLARNHWDDAVASFCEAIRLKPDFVEALFNLGAVFQQQGKIAEAAECFQQALRIKPEVGIVALCESAEARNRSGAIHREQGRLAEAGASARSFAEPRWDGGPLEDRTLLVYAEY